MSHKMGFKGIIHPMNKEEVPEKIRQLCEGAIEAIEKRDEPIDRDELVGFLKSVIAFTEPEVGFFYCPNVPHEALKKYGENIQRRDR